MYGFTESFNISVSAALILQHLVTEARRINIDWNLSGEEKETILLDWIRESVRSSDLIEQRFIDNQD